MAYFIDLLTGAFMPPDRPPDTMQNPGPNDRPDTKPEASPDTMLNPGPNPGPDTMLNPGPDTMPNPGPEPDSWQTLFIAALRQTGSARAKGRSDV